MAENIIGAVVPPVVAFLLVKVGEIGAEQRITKTYQHATVELGFWKLFIETQSLVCSPAEMDQVKSWTRGELDAVRDRIAAARTIRPVVIPTSKFRRVLLLYPAIQARAWFARAIFYCLTVYGFLLSCELFADPNMRGLYLLSIGSSVVLVVFVMAIWSRAIAARADESKAA